MATGAARCDNDDNNEGEGGSSSSSSEESSDSTEEEEEEEEGSERDLALILAATHEVLDEALGLCREGPDNQLTFQRALALADCRTDSSASSSGRAANSHRLTAFNPHKQARTIEINFGYWKQCLAYCYRVAYRGGHFSRRATTTGDEGSPGPEETVELTPKQRRAWDQVIGHAASLRATQQGPTAATRRGGKGGEEDDAAALASLASSERASSLRRAIRSLSLHLIS